MVKKERFFDKNFAEISFSQFVSIVGGLAAGILLAVRTDNLLLIPGIFVLLPGFLEMRGSISSTFASRLSSGLFLGLIDPNKVNTRVIRGNIAASFILVTIVSLVLGVVAFLLTFLIAHVLFPKIILLAFIAGLIANAIEITITVFATFYFFRKGHDPNNIMGPVLTSTGDVTSILALLIVMAVLL